MAEELSISGRRTPKKLLDLCQVSRTQLEVPAGFSFEQWQALGDELSRIEGSIMWWLGDWVRHGERSYGEQYAQAIEATDYTYDTVKAAQWVAERFNELVRRRTNLSWSHHKEVAALPPADADSFLDDAEEHGWTRQELRSVVSKYKRQARHQAIEAAAPSASSIIVPGQFNLIYADPPWSFEVYSELGKEMTSPENHYPTLSFEDIAKFEIANCPIAQLAADDAALYMWCTSSNFHEALNVVGAWGFIYKTHAVWDKRKSGTGYIFLNQHEVLIYASRGAIPAPLNIVSSVFSYERTKHSAKPPQIRTTIENMYPHIAEQHRIELFARGSIPGWTTYGNQAADAA